MQALGLTRPNDMLRRIGAGLRWWTGELAQLIPAGVREAFAIGSDATLIEVHAAEFVVNRQAGYRRYTVARIPRDDFAARTLRLSIPEARNALLADPVILQLPAAEALTRTLRLPIAARKDLEAILRHEVARQSPLDANDIYYDYRIVETTDDALSIELRIVRREPVDAIVQFLREAGVALAAIEFDGDAARTTGGTFPADAPAASRLRWRPRIVPMLFGVVALFAVLLVGAIYLRGEAVAADLNDRVEAARTRAMAVQRLQNQLDAANRQSAFLALQKRNPAAVAVLANVAHLLPQDAWLYEFEMNGNEVRIHGFSASAASLIALFDSSRYFYDAQLKAPLMQGPDARLQRFDIAFKTRSAR